MTDTSTKRFWQRFITPPTSSISWRRRAWSLWLVPPVLCFPLLLPLLAPSSLLELPKEYWTLCLFLFGIPFALGAYCWRRARRVS